MLQRLVAFSIAQRVFVIAAALALLIAGVRAAIDLPVEAFPDVQDVQVQIVTQAMGLAPEEVERAITLPIEREMNGVPRLMQLRSVSITGLSVVTLTFTDGTEDYFARAQTLEKLQGVSLPPGTQPQLAPLSNATGEIFRYMLDAPEGTDITELRALQDWVIEPAIRQVPAVADVVAFGGAAREYQARVDPQLLKKHGVTIDQVTAALAANSANGSGGVLTQGERSLVVRSIGLFRSLDDIRQTIVAVRNGHTVLVQDVAEVGLGQRPRQGIVGFNDRDDVVEGIVLMVKGNDPAKVIAALQQKLPSIQAKLPPGIRIAPFYDRTGLIHHTVSTVAENLAIGAFLVIAVLMLFLRSWRAALAVVVVIPLSLLTAFLAMDWRGMNANLISLGAVDFGIIIDSAVVLVEALMVKLAHDAWRESHGTTLLHHRTGVLRNTAAGLGQPILFSKAIIILAFLPIFTFQRVEGKIFAPMAFTLTFALLGAIVLTLTLLPSLLSFLLRGDALIERPSRWMDRTARAYRAILAKSATRMPLVFGASLAVLALALAGAPFLGSEFLPKLDEGNLWLTIPLTPSASLEQTKSIERDVRKILRSYPEVGTIVTQAGRPDDGTDPKGPNNLEVLADLKPRSEWRFDDKEKMIADMSAHIRTIPGISTNFSQVIQDNVEEALSGARGEIVVKIAGADLGVLDAKARQVVDVLNGIRGATDVGAFRIGGQTEVAVTLDRPALARLGVNIADVNNTVQTGLAGTAANTFFDGDRRFDVTVRLAKTYRDAVDDIGELPIALPNGAGTVPLASVARIETRQGASRIAREGGGRTIAVKVNLLGRDQGSFVAEAQARVDEVVKLPAGYTITWGGQFENSRRATARLQLIVPLSAALIFLLLFWAFRSMRLAGLVLALIPFTLVGGLAGLALAGLHLSVSAAVGFIAVAGISVQNGVIMVEHVLDLVRNGGEMGVAIVEGAVSRLRPIVMTALMAGLGLLPAALSHGIGSETQRPFAVVIVGGVVSATFFTLLLLPLLLSRFSVAPREE